MGSSSRAFQFAAESEEQSEARVQRELAAAARERTEYGSSGTSFFGGFVSSPNEYLAKFGDHTQYLTIYEEMRRSDGQVAAVIGALTLPIESASWSVHAPKDPTPLEEEITEYANDVLFEIAETGFAELLAHALTCIWAGFSATELVLGYDGSRIVVRRFAPRLASTIERFEWDTSVGRVVRLHQQAGSGPLGETPRPMPREKTLVVTLAQEGDDPRGVSVLRHAYKHWFVKDRLYRLDAIRLERHAVPPLVVTLPELAKGDEKTQAEKIAKDYRSYERGFIVLPYGFTAAVLDTKSGGHGDPGLLASVQHHDVLIARSVLAQFLNLGSTDTGARSLGESFLDLFKLALAAVAGTVARAISRDVLERLIPMNFSGDFRYPELRFDDLTETSKSALADSVSKLVSTAAIVPDDDLESWLRRAYRMPEAKRPEPGARPRPSPVPPVPTAAAPPVLSRVRSLSMRPPRTPHPAERFVAFRAINGAMDDAIAQAMDLTASARAAIVDDLVRQVVEAVKSGRPLAVESIEAPRETADAVASAIEELLVETYQSGRGAVAGELRRQASAAAVALARKRIADRPLSDPKKAKEHLAVRSRRVSDRVVDPLVASAKERASAAIRTGEPDPEGAREALSALSDRETRKSVGHAIPEAFGLGRDAEAREREDEIGTAVYSSLLDGNTCGPCSLADGTVVTVGSPRYEELSPPLSAQGQACEGGGLCRCIWVYVLSEDVETVGAPA